MSIQEVYTIIEGKNKEYRDLAIRFRNVCNDLIKKDKEIERLKKEKQELEEIINIRECQLEEMQESKTDYTQVNILEMKLHKLHSIIKEVREYIENNQEEHKYTDRGGFTYTEGHFLRDSDSLLEILDKVGDNNVKD